MSACTNSSLQDARGEFSAEPLSTIYDSLPKRPPRDNRSKDTMLRTGRVCLERVTIWKKLIALQRFRRNHRNNGFHTSCSEIVPVLRLCFIRNVPQTCPSKHTDIPARSVSSAVLTRRSSRNHSARGRAMTTTICGVCLVQVTDSPPCDRPTSLGTNIQSLASAPTRQPWNRAVADCDGGGRSWRNERPHPAYRVHSYPQQSTVSPNNRLRHRRSSSPHSDICCETSTPTNERQVKNFNGRSTADEEEKN